MIPSETVPKINRFFGRPMNFWSHCAFKQTNYQYWLARSCPDHSRSPWTDGHFEASVSFGSSFEWRRGTVRRRLIGDDAKCKFALRRKWVNQLARLQSEVHQLKWGPTTTKRQRGPTRPLAQSLMVASNRVIWSSALFVHRWMGSASRRAAHRAPPPRRRAPCLHWHLVHQTGFLRRSPLKGEFLEAMARQIGPKKGGFNACSLIFCSIPQNRNTSLFNAPSERECEIWPRSGGFYAYGYEVRAIK